jgi:hypothetical protein
MPRIASAHYSVILFRAFSGLKLSCGPFLFNENELFASASDHADPGPKTLAGSAVQFTSHVLMTIREYEGLVTDERVAPL